MCFDRERHTGSKDPLKENIICLPLKEDIICLPLKENIIWQIVGRDRSETGLHPPDLANQKNGYSSCSSDERRNWFYECLSSMDSTSTEVKSSLDLNV